MSRLAKLLLAAMLSVGSGATAQNVPEIVAVLGGDVEVRYPVAHLHERSVCFGYLYFTRDAIRYAVLRPVADRAHSVAFRRTEVAQAHQRPFFVLRMAAAEFALRSGQSLAFTPVLAGAVEGNRKLQDAQLPVELLLEAANNYQDLQTRLLARVRRPPAAAPAAQQLAERSAETPSQPPATPPASPASLATLIVSVRPGGAQVYLNDEFHGATSATEGRLVLPALAPGSYRVRLSAPGHQDWTQSVTLASGQTLTLAATLRPTGPTPLSADDIVGLLSGAVSAKRVSGLVTERGVSFSLTDQTERRIREAGGDDSLLLAIAKARK